MWYMISCSCRGALKKLVLFEYIFTKAPLSFDEKLELMHKINNYIICIYMNSYVSENRTFVENESYIFIKFIPLILKKCPQRIQV